MKPSPELVLNRSFAKILTDIGPALPAGYGQGSATLVAVLLLMLGQEFGRAASACAAENRAMRELFREHAGRVPGELGARLAQEGSGAEAGLELAALEKANARLKAVLIALHEFAEQAGDNKLELRILGLLSAASEARLVVLPPM